MPHRFPGAWKEIEELRTENVQLRARITELEALLKADPNEVVPLKPNRRYQVKAQVVREGD